MAANFESIEEAVNALLTTTVVACPETPLEIPGIGLNTYTTLDAFGTQMVLTVPKRGVIVSAIYFDLDFEGLQVNLHIFKHYFVPTAIEATWAPSDADIVKYVTRLSFVAFDSHSTNYTAELTNVGTAYTAPEGKFWIQAQCVGAQDMASLAVMPRFQLQIQSFDPTFKES